MNGLGAAPPRHVHNPLDAQVAFGRGRRPDVISLVGVAHVQRLAVSVGIDGYGADAHLPAGAHHAQGNLASIGNENLIEQTFPFQAQPTSELE